MTVDSQRLAQPLDAARVKVRDSGRGGQKLAYLETHDVIRAANDIFGFGQWGHEIIELRPIAPVTVTNPEGKVGQQVGYICIVRLTVADCVPVSGVGYGDAVEYRESAPVTAHELAAKEAESDALKRALKNYGDQFGLALYDKQATQNGHVVMNPAKPNGNGSGRPRADSDQVDALMALAKKLVADKRVTVGQIASVAGGNLEATAKVEDLRSLLAVIDTDAAAALLTRLERYAENVAANA